MPPTRPGLFISIAIGVLPGLALAPAGVAAQNGDAVDLSVWATDFSRHAVPFEEIVGGGPPKDGIPALDAPRFDDVDTADRWLEDREPVAVVERGGEVKAYPLQILIWHEIVNDVVGGDPVSVTFCPLCNTTIAFDRRVGDRVLDFGTTGLLRFSDMVMYDRQTESWWQQATGEGIVGAFTGERLDLVPAPVLRWEEVRDSWPEARVLNRETGHDRRYGMNPYRGYDNRRAPLPGFAPAHEDRRLNAMDRVVTLDEGGAPLAIPFEDLAERRVVAVATPAGRRVVFWTPGMASALNRERVATGQAVGSVAVYRPELDGEPLRFEAVDGERFRDAGTGSLWTIRGEAVEGPLTGRRLEPVAHATPFWFAWVLFRPETEVWGR